MPASGSLGRWKGPLLAAVLLVGVGLRLAALEHHRAADYDEGRYLDNAANILQGRGLSTNYTSHFFRMAPGLHPEEISSPLYPYLLAGTYALTDFVPASAHRVAQLWSFLPGCLTILLVFVAGERLFDQRTALLASVLVALNPDMVILSSWAMTESLYAMLLLAILTLAATLGTKPRGGAWAWGCLGILCGALYLLRANGLAVAAGVGLASLLPWTGGAAETAGRLARSGLFAAVFLATVSPWLIRNQIEFGSPTHTAMKNVAWSDSGRDLFRRDRPPPSFASFLREHGAGGLARNVALRLWRAARALVWGDTGGYNLICLLYPLALVLTWRQPGLRAGHLAILFSAALLAGVPAWTGALSRYMLPARPWIYLSVIGAALQMAPALAWKRHLSRWDKQPKADRPLSTEPARRLTAATTATLVAAIGWASLGPLRAYVSTDERSKDAVAREAAAWIASRTEPGSVLMEGAYVHQYAFIYDRPVVWTPAGGMDELIRAATDYRARYLVVSGELIRFHPELKRHFEVDEQGVRAVDLPAGFQEVFAGMGRKVVIWRLPGAPA